MLKFLQDERSDFESLWFSLLSLCQELPWDSSNITPLTAFMLKRKHHPSYLLENYPVLAQLFNDLLQWWSTDWWIVPGTGSFLMDTIHFHNESGLDLMTPIIFQHGRGGRLSPTRLHSRTWWTITCQLLCTGVEWTKKCLQCLMWLMDSSGSHKIRKEKGKSNMLRWKKANSNCYSGWYFKYVELWKLWEVWHVD